MKHCQECNVDVNPRLSNCPLCGSFLSAEKEDLPTEKIQEKVLYPQLTVGVTNSRNFLKKRLFWLLLLAVTVCIAINWIMYAGTLWSGYVVFGAVVAYFVVINSVYKKRRFYSALGSAAIICCFCILGFDIVQSLDSVGNLSRVAFSVEYVIPAILTATIIASDVLIICNKSKYRYYFVSLLGASIIALLPQLAIWIFALPLTQWFAFSLFFFALLNMLVMVISFWKSFRQEMLRKFNL